MGPMARPIAESYHVGNFIVDLVTSGHESYHFGALGVIRRELGLPETLPLAMEAAQKQEA